MHEFHANFVLEILIKNTVFFPHFLITKSTRGVISADNLKISFQKRYKLLIPAHIIRKHGQF